MGASSLLLVAAVPLLPAETEGAAEPPPPEPVVFWLNRLFGSGRRRRKVSRDIGTCITEEQLERESPSPPLSPRAPPPAPPATSARRPPCRCRQRRLPDLVTCCRPPPDARADQPDLPEAVFVFPAGADTVQHQYMGPRRQVTPAHLRLHEQRSGLGRPSPAAAPAGPRAPRPGSPRHPLQEAAVLEVGRSLRLCADALHVQVRRRPRPGRQQVTPAAVAACGALWMVVCWLSYKLTQ